MNAFFFGRLHHGGGVGVLGEHVGALADQGHGGFALLARVVPGVDPDDTDLGLGIDAARTHGEGVDALQDLGDGKGGDIAQHVGLGHLACDHAIEVAALVETGVVVAEVLAGFVAGGMYEGDVGKLACNAFDVVHVAKAGGQHHLVAAGGEFADHPFGIGALGDVLDVLGLDLVAERLLHLLAAFVMLEGPAGVTDGADIDQTDLGGVLGLGGEGQGGCNGQGGRRAHEMTTLGHADSPSGWVWI
ncbi:hypothetical protein SDC9_156087 [bioreactor metagenome]|uniref:NAD-specific glutamate dehydrogenase n=1 Tax=bioreactor metagenome TaxID=1076179 RepID=A0A645F5K3_9ZZZZ